MLGLILVSLPYQAPTSIQLSDRSGQLKFRLNLADGCTVDTLDSHNKPLGAKANGLWSGIKVGGQWYTTAKLAHEPTLTHVGDKVGVNGIEYGGGGVRVREIWTFTPKSDSIQWDIARTYLDGGSIEDTAMPMLSFETMSTWAGALLGTGGIAWNKLLDAPNATYGVHTNWATLWKRESDTCLRFTVKPEVGQHGALRFTRDTGDSLSIASEVTPHVLQPKTNKARFNRDGQDIWAAFTVQPAQISRTSIEFKAPSYREVYGRGNFKGLDTTVITELINTIGRIGVIDDGLVGSNGWYSGYICMHEPWLARVGTAINDPNYTRSCAHTLDYAREHAVMPDGMVKSRWKYDDGDAQAGSYDNTSGFYEAQWGRLMDSQSSYVTNVADQFDQSGDRSWVRRQKDSCEAALEYLLRRDTNGNHLVEMINDSTSQHRSSDWLDIVWASHENALVNAQLYGALIKWSAVERQLGDDQRANYYQDYADKLKASFNKPIAEGGFWNPEKHWYAYWRDADGSVHGNNLVIPVNLTALADGICDEPERRKALLDTIESKMKAESLLCWPSCFESYAPGEGANDKFPTYENGDVFLAWAEYGVRAYASTEPQIALKYVKRIVEQYKKDGLAFQRYLRASGKGAGDDILANNCNVMTGLYRDIFGIQPKHNRFYLDPHLVGELNGTRVSYNFRGKPLSIDLLVNDYKIDCKGASIRSAHAFAVDFTDKGLTYFAGVADSPSLTVQPTVIAPIDVHIVDWSARKRWTVSTGAKPIKVVHTFHDLAPGARYRVVSAGVQLGLVSVEQPLITIQCKVAGQSEFELIAIR